jgi:hypothetical protein
MNDIDIFRTGDRLQIEHATQCVRGRVLAASNNGKSMILALDAKIDGHVGTLSVLMDDAGDYRSTMSYRLITLTKIDSDAIR